MELSGIETTLLSSTDIMHAIEQELSPIKSILQGCFNRVETKASSLSYFQGLISAVERKNSWQLAEKAGCQKPYAFQYVLAVASNCTITIGFEQYKANALLESFEMDDWQTISAGAGSKGQRYYQWARKIINSESPDVASRKV